MRKHAESVCIGDYEDLYADIEAKLQKQRFAKQKERYVQPESETQT